MASELTDVRPSSASDEAFIFASWLRNFQKSGLHSEKIPRSVLMRKHHAVIERLLARPTVGVLIAHPKGDPDTIVGWLVWERSGADTERPVVHYVYVKGAFRKYGIARQLLESAGLRPNSLAFSHWTLAVNVLVRKYPGLVYDPYTLH